MSIKCSVYIATSVDGFIARPNGDIDWLHNPAYADVPLKGLGYEDFMASVDVLVMGRHTYEKVLSFPQWPYEQVQVVVLSGSAVNVPDRLHDRIRVECMTPTALVEQLTREGRTHAYVDGGVTVQRFLQAGLIDELTLTRIPVLLGEGLPLFTCKGPERSLQLIDCAVSDNGFVQERYKVLPPI